MLNSEWVQDDGYMESIITLFTPDSTPVLKARAVYSGEEEEFNAIVRDYKTGHIVASSFIHMNLEEAKIKALELSRNIIKSTCD